MTSKAKVCSFRLLLGLFFLAGFVGSSSGITLKYSSWLGGADTDSANGVAVNAAGEALGQPYILLRAR